jgi:hypothetical protein
MEACQQTSTTLRGITNQKPVLFIATTMRTYIPALPLIICYEIMLRVGGGAGECTHNFM